MDGNEVTYKYATHTLTKTLICTVNILILIPLVGRYENISLKFGNSEDHCKVRKLKFSGQNNMCATKL